MGVAPGRLLLFRLFTCAKGVEGRRLRLKLASGSEKWDTFRNEEKMHMYVSQTSQDVGGLSQAGERRPVPLQSPVDPLLWLLII